MGRDFARPDGPSLRALEDVSFGIADSEIVSLVGPSGCGKSTLLRMIAGFDFPDAGELLLDGKRIAEPGQDRGVVFQQPQLYPWLNVLDNVCFGPRMRGVPRERISEAAGHYIRSVGLERFESHYPYQLSGGMRQRLQIARVLINEPRVLLMDEPFGALDYQTRLGMQRLLLELAAEYRPTVLFITHDIDEAIFISDRVHVMSPRPGRIIETIEVDIPRPRVYDEVSASAPFMALKLRTLKLLAH
ncbi:MAG TPA: ABC transporter ATP-binding protein [Burkholderiales bacterium]|nr:ABC transporter ATP-binding protein [Burkholderiales bacterium]